MRETRKSMKQNQHVASRCGQGRGQEFFQGRAPGESRIGSQPFSKFQGGGGLNPDILVAPIVKMKEFSGRGGVRGPPLPMAAYA